MDKSGQHRPTDHQASDPLALPPVDEAQALRDISKALFAMRDALTKLQKFDTFLPNSQFPHPRLPMNSTT